MTLFFFEKSESIFVSTFFTIEKLGYPCDSGAAHAGFGFNFLVGDSLVKELCYLESTSKFFSFFF